MPTIVAPSDLAVEVRRIKGTDLIALAKQSDGESTATGDGGFSTVIGGCWVNTVDPGPYSFVVPGDARPEVQRLLKGDVLWMFVEMRRISMPDGDEYTFPVRCEECGHRYDWTVDLAKDLPGRVKRLSKASAANVRAGKPFETNVAGKRVTFALQTIEQEEPVTRLMKQQQRDSATMVDGIVGQLLTIEGLKTNDIRARWQFVSGLDLSDLYKLREALDEHDCGIDTAIQTRCTKRQCRWEQDINLPLGKTFFAPRRKKAPIQDMQSSSSASSEASPDDASGSSSTTSSGPSTEAAATP